MVANAWVSTWRHSALRVAGIEPTEFALKALSLWSKSTPTEPWSMNPLGVPARGYARRTVPGTSYALFLRYSDFSKAFAKALQTEPGKSLRQQLLDGESIAKLWRSVREMNWPATDTESDYPGEIHTWIGDQYRELLNIPKEKVSRTSGTTSQARLNNHRVVQAHHLMVTAAQTKLDLADAILLITKGVR